MSRWITASEAAEAFRKEQLGEPRGKVIHQRGHRRQDPDFPVADDLLDASVKLVRNIGVFRRDGDAVARSGVPVADKLIAAEARIKQYFPRLRRREVVLLARVIVHIGSASLRHALGIVYILPERDEPIPVPVYKRYSDMRYKHRVWANKAMTESISLDSALRQLFQVKPRLMTSEIMSMMRERDWVPATQGRSMAAYVRDYMDREPGFQRVGRRSKGAILWSRRGARGGRKGRIK